MAIAFDALSTSGLSTTPATWSHTCSGSNRLLIVGVYVTNTLSAFTVSATYNGVAMTLLTSILSQFGTCKLHYFYLVAPATGAHTVSVTNGSGGADDWACTATSWTGVDQSTPLGAGASAFGFSAAPSVNVVSVAGDLVVDTTGHGSAGTLTCTPHASQATLGSVTNLNNSNTTLRIRDLQSSETAAGTSTTMSYTMSGSQQWCIVGAALKASVGGTDHVLAGTTAGVGGTTGALTITKVLAGTTAGVGSVVGALGLNQALSGGTGAIGRRTPTVDSKSVSSTSHTVTLPTGLADGDVVYIALNSTSANVSAAPTGFVQLAALVAQSGSHLYGYRKVITNAAGEGAWTFTLSITSVSGSVCECLTGVDQTTPEDTAVTTGTNTAASNTSFVCTATGVTTVTAGAELLYAVGVGSNSSAMTPPSGMTELGESTGHKTEMAYEVRATPGATGDRAAAAAANNLAWAAWMVAVRPAAGVTGTTAGVGATTGTITVDRALTGLTAGVGATSGSLTTAHLIAGTTAGSGATTGALIVAAALAGTPVAVGDLTGLLAINAALAGESAGAGEMAGTFGINHDIDGITDGVGGLSGALNLTGALSGVTSASGDVIGALLVERALASISEAAGGLAGLLDLNHALSGTTDVVGGMVGDLLVVHPPPPPVAHFVAPLRVSAFTAPTRATDYIAPDRDSDYILGE